MVSRQLELALGNQRGLRPVRGRRNRSGRASWWFEKMHGVVNQARDWEPAPVPEDEERQMPPRAGDGAQLLEGLAAEPVMRVLPARMDLHAIPAAPRRKLRGPMHKEWQ